MMKLSHLHSSEKSTMKRGFTSSLKYTSIKCECESSSKQKRIGEEKQSKEEKKRSENKSRVINSIQH